MEKKIRYCEGKGDNERVSNGLSVDINVESAQYVHNPLIGNPFHASAILNLESGII